MNTQSPRATGVKKRRPSVNAATVVCGISTRGRWPRWQKAPRYNTAFNMARDYGCPKWCPVKTPPSRQTAPILSSHLADEAEPGDVGVVVGRLPAEQRRNGDDGGDGPAGGDHGEYSPDWSVVDVVDTSNGPVTVEGDSDEVKD